MKGWAWLCLVSTISCANARTDLRFDGLEHPVSMSPHLPARPDEPEPVLIAPFEADKWAFGLVYGYIPLDEEVELSALIEEQIARLGGTAVVNLEIEVRHCPLNYVIPLSLLPMWPNCSVIQVRGEVVGPPL